MAQYQIVTVPATGFPSNKQGVIKPLCSSCIAPDCQHKIELIELSIFGIPEKHRVLCRGNQRHFVMGCDGYVKDKDN